MIPFVRDIQFRYGEPDQVSPLIRRVIADNPGPFTFTGTGTYIVGRGEVAVIERVPDRQKASTGPSAASASRATASACSGVGRPTKGIWT